MKKAILYLNQFFGQIGGEDKADFEPVLENKPVGPALVFNSIAKDVKVEETLICGDNYMASHTQEAIDRCLKLLEDQKFDMFIAGPAFNAGRYGNACGLMCKAVAEKFHVPVITSMNEENPGVEMFRKDAYIFKGGKRATHIKDDMTAMAKFADKIATGKTLLPAAMEGYFPRGIRHEVFLEDLGLEPIMAADRAVDMLLAKLKGEPYETELPIPKQDLVPIAPAVKDITKVKIALVTSGGIVPSDNPDRIESCSATRWGKYDISGLDRLSAPEFKTIHAGYDPEMADKNPNVVEPLDAIRELQREGKLGEVDDYFYTTVGTGTTQGEAARMGREIANELHQRNVQAVILTATWGTCTRCGATMAKEIERSGIPIAVMCNLTNIAKTVGSNRIVPTFAVPYPLGNPQASPEEEWAMRLHRVEVAVDALQTPVTEQTIFEVRK